MFGVSLLVLFLSRTIGLPILALNIAPRQYFEDSRNQTASTTENGHCVSCSAGYCIQLPAVNAKHRREIGLCFLGCSSFPDSVEDWRCFLSQHLPFKLQVKDEHGKAEAKTSCSFPSGTMFHCIRAFSKRTLSYVHMLSSTSAN